MFTNTKFDLFEFSFILKFETYNNTTPHSPKIEKKKLREELENGLGITYSDRAKNRGDVQRKELCIH